MPFFSPVVDARACWKRRQAVDASFPQGLLSLAELFPLDSLSLDLLERFPLPLRLRLVVAPVLAVVLIGACLFATGAAPLACHSTHTVFVAKGIPRKFWYGIPRATAATDKKWAMLRATGCWDQDRVAEHSGVSSRCKRQGKSLHTGRIHDICVEKHSELTEEERVYKGRVVFGGHNVRNEEGLQVIFNDGGSGASFMSASKLLDAVALLPGNKGEQSDAQSAYTQALIQHRDEETWVELPRHQWPDALEKKNLRRPICPLMKAIYGLSLIHI